MEYKFLLSYLLIGISIFVLYKEKVGLERELLLSSIRAFLQLLILGYALVFILKLQNIFEMSFVLLLMVAFATYTANSRVKIKDGYRIGFLSIFLSSFLVIGVAVFTGMLETTANQIIPIGGMMIGNALNAYTQTMERFKSDIKANIEIVENFVALGTSLREAFRLQIIDSTRSALIPIINNLQTLGIIWIPGITAGMVLAGANPLHAVFFQLLIMFGMVAVAVLTSFLATNLSYRHILWYL